MTNVLNGIPLKYKGLPEDIAREIWSYEDSYFCNDLPIPFKGLNIYPVLMKDYNIFSAVIDCCTLNKNLDAKGITKTHLDYLCSLFEDNGPSGKLWLTKFTKLIELSFHVKNGFLISEELAYLKSSETSLRVHDGSAKQVSSSGISTSAISRPSLSPKNTSISHINPSCISV